MDRLPASHSLATNDDDPPGALCVRHSFARRLFDDASRACLARAIVHAGFSVLSCTPLEATVSVNDVCYLLSSASKIDLVCVCVPPRPCCAIL
mmetsp:Transcript_606/g.2385  ORF Transcript_606/g.2385 Transcript_606/m.2385 type:complete len:93 (-) Transcript_606:595-873(-)